MKCIVAVLFPAILCGVSVAFSVLQKYDDLGSEMDDFILLNQQYTYMSALESQRVEDQERQMAAVLFRHVRDTENKRQECCIKEKKDISEKDLVYFLECLNATLITDEEKFSKPNTTDRLICVAECMANKYAVINEEGYLLEDKMQTLAKDKTDSNDVVEANEDYIKRCSDFGNRFAKARGRVTFGEQNCNQATFLFVGCMKMLSDVNCPEDKKVDTEECDSRREKYSEAIEILNI